MSQITFLQCLETGIKLAANNAGWSSLFGRSLSMIASGALGGLAGATAGNYIVHNIGACKKFEETTKRIIVVTMVAFATTALFGIFNLGNRIIDYSQFAKKQISSALFNYWVGWGYIEPKPIVKVDSE